MRVGRFANRIRRHTDFNGYCCLHKTRAAVSCRPSIVVRPPTWLLLLDQRRALGYLSKFDPSCLQNRKQDHPITTEHHDSANTTSFSDFNQDNQEFLIDLLDANADSLPVDDPDFWTNVERTLHWLLRRRHKEVHEEEGIRTCIQVLDRLASGMPRDAAISASLLDGPVFWGNLETSVLNKVLFFWKQQLLSNAQHRKHRGSRNILPSPSEMAEKVDRYRWTCLVQPNAASFNILIHAMVRVEGVGSADTYLHRLLQVAVQEISAGSGDAEDRAFPLVDTIGIATVIQGWANAGEPEKAQQWLDRMVSGLDRTSKDPFALLHIQPNTRSFTFAMHGWARKGNAKHAQSLLEKLLDLYKEHGDENLAPDRVLFHTVLDAWSKVRDPNERRTTAPHCAAQLVEAMEQMGMSGSDKNDPDISFSNDVRPDMETWCMLAAIYARSTSQKFGPMAAEKLLLEVERTLGEVASIVPVNRILYAYGNNLKMEDAERFLSARLELAASQRDHECQPNEITMNTLLAGFANVSKSRSDAPMKADAWLKRFHDQYGIAPSIQTYSNILNAWANSVGRRDDAADRAERILRHEVVELYYDGKQDQRHIRRNSVPPGRFNNAAVHDFTVCLNIVLRAWAVHASRHKRKPEESRHAVERMLQLLHEFLQDHEEAADIEDGISIARGLAGVQARPTVATFRTVFHGILDSSILLKDERARVILELMERHGFEGREAELRRLSPNDSAKKI